MSIDYTLSCNNSSSVFLIRDILSKVILEQLNLNKDIIILCIGSDRSTGDSLGPLVGSKLSFLNRKKLSILGDLENPVNAQNIDKIKNNIYKKYKKPYIIAIDASLGSMQSVETILIQDKPLSPGAALNKNILSIGDLSIKGIVNVSGSLDFMVLQNTRLNTVMNLADVISEGIYHCIIKTMGNNKYFNKVNVK
ncbi:spore protease YyaC [Clostridium sp. DL1XJH146]